MQRGFTFSSEVIPTVGVFVSFSFFDRVVFKFPTRSVWLFVLL